MAKQNEQTPKNNSGNGEDTNVTLTPDPTPRRNTPIVEDVDLADPVRYVNTRGIETHDCRIGGTKYLIEKGKEQVMPEDAALILAERQIVLTLGSAKAPKK